MEIFKVIRANSFQNKCFIRVKPVLDWREFLLLFSHNYLDYCRNTKIAGVCYKKQRNKHYFKSTYSVTCGVNGLDY